MKIVYTGGLPEGEIAIGELRKKFKRGEPVEVSDELGKQLVKRGDWQAADTKGKAQ